MADSYTIRVSLIGDNQLTKVLQETATGLSNLRAHAAAASGSGGLGGLSVASVALGTALGNLASGGLNLLLGGLSRLGSAVTGAVGEMISSNAQFEQYNTRFEVLLGSVDEAKARMNDLAKFGATTPFDLPGVVEADLVLQGFGLHSEEAAQKFGFTGEEIRTIAGDIASGTGKSFQEMALLIGKFSSGATGEAISRMQELGIATREQLAGMGLEFSKSGQLMSPLPEAMNVVLSLMQDKYGGLMDAQSRTFDGMMSNLRDWVGNTLRVIGQPIFETLKDKLGVLLEFLNSPEVQTGITSVANALAEGLGAALDKLNPLIDGTIATVKELLAAFQQGGLTAAIDLIKDKFSSAWPAIQETLAGWSANFWGWLTGSGGVTSGIGEHLSNLVGGISDFLANSWPTIAEKLGEWSNRFWDWVLGPDGALVRLAEVMTSITNQIATWAASPEGQGKLTALGENLGLALVDGLKLVAANSTKIGELLGILVGTTVTVAGSMLAAWMDIGGTVAGGMISGIIEKLGGGEASGEISSALGEVWQTAVQGIVSTVIPGTALAFAGKYFSNLKEQLGDQDFGGLAESVMTTFSDAVKDSGGAIAKAWDGIWKSLSKSTDKGSSSILDKVTNWLKQSQDNIGTTWNQIKAGLDRTWNDIKNNIVRVTGDIASNISSWLNQISSNISTAWANIKKVIADRLNEIAQNISQRFGEFVSTITQKLGEIVQQVIQKWTEVKNQIAAKLGEIGQNISQKWTEFVTTISQKLGEILSSVTQKWAEIRSQIDAKLNEIKTSITTRWAEYLQTIQQKLGEILSNVVSKWQEIKTNIETKLNEIKTTIFQKWEEIKTNISTALDNIKATALQKWEEIKTTISDKIAAIADLVKPGGALYEKLKQMGIDIITAIKAGWDAVTDFAARLLEKITGWLSGLTFPVNIGSIGTKIVDSVKAAWDAITNFGSDFLSWLLDQLSGISVSSTAVAIRHVARAIGDAILAAIRALTNFGQQVIDAVWDAVVGTGSSAQGLGAKVGDDIATGMSDALGIHSRSRVAEYMGRMIREGLQVGIGADNPLRLPGLPNIGATLPALAGNSIGLAGAGAMGGSRTVTNHYGGTTVQAAFYTPMDLPQFELMLEEAQRRQRRRSGE